MVRIVNAQNSCYYKCDRMMEKPNPQPPSEYKTVGQIKEQMMSQIHQDAEYRKKAKLSGVDKALEKKTEEVAKTKAIKDIVKAVQAEAPVAKPVPAPAPAPAPVAGNGNDDAVVEEEEAKDIVKKTMRDKSKSIIAKLMDKEKNKSRKMKKGSGIQEI